MFKKLHVLLVIALVAILAIACSPDAGTNPGNELPGLDFEMPSDAPAAKGDFKTFHEQMASSAGSAGNMTESDMAALLLMNAVAIGQQVAQPGTGTFESGKVYVINGEKINSSGVAFWGGFLAEEKTTTMTADGILKINENYIFDITGYMTMGADGKSAEGKVSINGTVYEFSGITQG